MKKKAFEECLFNQLSVIFYIIHFKSKTLSFDELCVEYSHLQQLSDFYVSKLNCSSVETLLT